MDLKVVQVNGLDIKGGAAKISYLLHKEYLKRGIRSSLLVGQKLSDEKEIKEIKGRYTNRFVDKYSRILKIKDLLPINNTDFFSDKNYRESSVVHLHNIHGGYFNLKNLSQISKQKPVVWTLHDMWAFTANSPHTYGCDRWIEAHSCNCGKHNSVFLRAEENILLNRKKKIYEESDFVIAVPSMWMKQQVDKSILKKKRIEVIYNGVDEKIFMKREKKMCREELNLPVDKKIICFVAHNGLRNQWKGGEYFSKAWNIISSQDENTLLLEIGVDGNEIMREKNHIKVPYVLDKEILSKYYNASDIFMFSSLGESSSLVAMESLACGVPVVSFDVGPLSEIVNDGSNGLLVKYMDADDLAAKALVLLKDERLYNRMKSNARDSVVRKYTFSNQVEKYINLYQEVIKNYEN